MSLRLPETGTFEDLLRPVRVEVSSLVRLSRYPATEPYWSSGVYRFDDPDPGRAGEFGACYTAGSIEVAFAAVQQGEVARYEVCARAAAAGVVAGISENGRIVAIHLSPAKRFGGRRQFVMPVGPPGKAPFTQLPRQPLRQGRIIIGHHIDRGAHLRDIGRKIADGNGGADDTRLGFQLM